MARYQYIKPLRLAHLHDELLAAGIIPTLMEGTPDQSECWITVPDATPRASVDAVVAAHDAAAWDARDAQAAQDATNDLTSRTALMQTAQTQYQQLQNDITAWPGMTIAQQRDAMLRTMQALGTTMHCLAAIVRIMRRDGT